MLSNEKVKEAISTNEIEITISFGIEDGNIVEYTEEKNLLLSPLHSNLYSDRLKLTMGPIINVLNKPAISSKYRFKTFPNFYDLRKSNNRFIIHPGESVIVLTNERIKLNGRYACLIVPRISLSDVGIVVTTAYVDPFYDGVMRLHLSNFSNKAYELKSLEAIAQCFFFELSDPVSKRFKEQFSQKSVFFGQTWSEIIHSDRNPFPTKKGAASINKLSDLKYQLGLIWAFIKKHSLIFALITNIALISIGYNSFVEKLTDYNMVLDQIETSLKPLASEIVINPGESYGEKEIVVDYAKSEIVGIICNNDEIYYKILSGDTEDETKIIFSFSLSSPPTDVYEINFTYSILRSIQK